MRLTWFLCLPDDAARNLYHLSRMRHAIIDASQPTGLTIHGHMASLSSAARTGKDRRLFKGLSARLLRQASSP